MNRSRWCPRPLARCMTHVLLPATLLLNVACADRAGEPAQPALRDELLELGRVDQEVRANLTMQRMGDTLLLRRMMQVDSANTLRLREIVSAHGWPGRSLVGEEAARAAFLIVQHSPSQEFQQEMLEQLRAAVDAGEADRGHLAMLHDRVLTDEGKPQLYGTQFQLRDDRLVPYPIADPARLDERRAQMGLTPMSEYVATLREAYQGPVDFDTTRLTQDSTTH